MALGLKPGMYVAKCNHLNYILDRAHIIPRHYSHVGCDAIVEGTYCPEI